jgi:hypothetical protein
MARMGVQETGITALVETLLNDHIRADWKNLVNEYISERKDSLPDSSKYLHQAGLGQPLLPVLISDWHCPANSISRKCDLVCPCSHCVRALVTHVHTFSLLPTVVVHCRGHACDRLFACECAP